MNEEQQYYSLTQRVFTTLGPFYNWFTIPLVRVREQVVQVANLCPDARVLDVATGTGQQALAFAKHGYDVTGMDLTAAMLKIANQHNKNKAVRFQIGDATQLQFATSSFDATSISFALHDMPTAIQEKTLREMVRVTKPGGAILIIDYALPENRLGRTLFYHLISLYEVEYYQRFIHSDLNELIQRVGVQMVQQVSILMGAGQILKVLKP